MKTLFVLTVVCLSFTASYAQSSSTLDWNVYDCKRDTSACVDKTNRKEAYGSSFSIGSQTWSLSVTLSANADIAIVSIFVTMPNNHNFVPHQYQYDISESGTIFNSRWLAMEKVHHCNRLHQSWCYDWKLQSGKAPPEVLDKFRPAFQKLVEQDKLFASFF